MVQIQEINDNVILWFLCFNKSWILVLSKIVVIVFISFLHFLEKRIFRIKFYKNLFFCALHINNGFLIFKCVAIALFR